MVDIARQLQARPPEVARTDDFVVVAADTLDDDRADNLRAVAPEIYEAYRQRGWLPPGF